MSGVMNDSCACACALRLASTRTVTCAGALSLLHTGHELSQGRWGGWEAAWARQENGKQADPDSIVDKRGGRCVEMGGRKVVRLHGRVY